MKDEAATLRKKRKVELKRTEVRWVEYGRIYMRWYSRSGAAKRFASRLKASGYEVLVATW
jgi:hypothetical protein